MLVCRLGVMIGELSFLNGLQRESGLLRCMRLVRLHRRLRSIRKNS